MSRPSPRPVANIPVRIYRLGILPKDPGLPKIPGSPIFSNLPSLSPTFLVGKISLAHRKTPPLAESFHLTYRHRGKCVCVPKRYLAGFCCRDNFTITWQVSGTFAPAFAPTDKPLCRLRIADFSGAYPQLARDKLVRISRWYAHITPTFRKLLPHNRIREIPPISFLTLGEDC